MKGWLLLLIMMTQGCEIINRNYKSLEQIVFIVYSNVEGPDNPHSTSIRSDHKYVQTVVDETDRLNILSQYPCAVIYTVNTDNHVANFNEITQWTTHVCQTHLPARCVVFGETAKSQAIKRQPLKLYPFVGDTVAQIPCDKIRNHKECVGRCEYTGGTYGCRDRGQFCGYQTRISCETRSHCTFITGVCQLVVVV
jgi:hypothetical protein